jgi:hypothetical protein
MWPDERESSLSVSGKKTTSNANESATFGRLWTGYGLPGPAT